MCGDDLRPEQVEKLKQTLRRQLQYLNRLCGRMQTLGFPIEDPLCRSALAARNAMQDLYSAAHYAGGPARTMPPPGAGPPPV